MPTKIIIRANDYHDSMFLMQINHRIMEIDGVIRAAILMGTKPNKKLLAKNGFKGSLIDSAGLSDMMIGLEADNKTILEATEKSIIQLLKESGSNITQSGSKTFITLDTAMKQNPETNLVLISTPGQFAAREAYKALANKSNVFIFSDNVSVEEEIELKQEAKKLGLLVMGPDCGTSIIDGVAIGFANKVPRGFVGIIGAAGTGIQELTVLLHRFGNLGISQAIGVGGRDLSKAVQGIGTVQAMQLLSADPLTKYLVLISKPPSEKVAKKLIIEAGNIKKPVIICFLGANATQEEDNFPPNVRRVANIEQAALEIIQCSKEKLANVLMSAKELDILAIKEAKKLSTGQKFVRGIFSGGSLCYEAMIHLKETIKPIYCNIPVSGTNPIDDIDKSVSHTFLDMGNDEFTVGKVHPMIDPTSVSERILLEADHDDVGIILLDIVLGYGAHPNPSKILAPAIGQAKKKAQMNDRYLIIICHVCGTKQDPQDLEEQETVLQNAGALTMMSNIEACRLTAAIINKI